MFQELILFDKCNVPVQIANTLYSSGTMEQATHEDHAISINKCKTACKTEGVTDMSLTWKCTMIF